MTRQEVIKKTLRGEITWIEATGAQGLMDLRIGKRSPRRTEDWVRDRIFDLYRNQYRDECLDQHRVETLEQANLFIALWRIE